MSRGRQPYQFVAEGCATGWAECPHGDEAITVRRAGSALTECARRGTVELVEAES